MTPQDTADTRLGRAVRRLADAHPSLSGILALPEGRDAFAARMLLAEAAERTLDAQYYIWHGDMSGTLLFEALRRAADRGVRVRLLLDDNYTSTLDRTLAALDAHPNVEVRLFNPFVLRRWRLLGLVTDFARLNRRMHNKSFTVDGQVTIVGGRNVGDEYFDAGQGVSFADLDVLAIGPVVDDVSRDFDRYWTSASARSGERALGRASADSIAEERAAAAAVERAPAASEYTRAIASSPFVERLLAEDLPLEWARTHMVSDDPSKALGRARDDALLWTRLERVVGPPKSELLLVSAYFVPGTPGVEFLTSATRRGVRVTVLTNSLEATDVPAVHVGYAKRRKPLLEAGVVLLEMKRAFPASLARARSLAGSSRTSLHAKTFSVDGERAFVGSFNFDPRSARLNTEMGFVIESPVLARKLADVCSVEAATRAYRVRLTENGSLRWIEQVEGKEVEHDREPGAGLVQRAGVWLLSKLPIEWLL